MHETLGHRGQRHGTALASLLWVMLLTRIKFFPAQGEEKHRNETFKQKATLLFSHSHLLLLYLFFCFSLVPVLADTAGWKEINLHPLKYVFSE